jgi:hypothetical protein
MVKTPKKEPSVEDVELIPDAWPKFEKFVKGIAKAGPQHRPPATPPQKHKEVPRRRKPKATD